MAETVASQPQNMPHRMNSTAEVTSGGCEIGLSAWASAPDPGHADTSEYADGESGKRRYHRRAADNRPNGASQPKEPSDPHHDGSVLCTSGGRTVRLEQQ